MGILNFLGSEKLKKDIQSAKDRQDELFYKSACEAIDTIKYNVKQLKDIIDTLRFIGINREEKIKYKYDGIYTIVTNESETIKYICETNTFICHHIHNLFDKEKVLFQALREKAERQGLEDLKTFADDLKNFVQEQTEFIQNLK